MDIESLLAAICLHAQIYINMHSCTLLDNINVKEAYKDQT